MLPRVPIRPSVSAVDANYYEHYGHDSDPFTSTSLPSTLRGAVGVFGALMPLVRMTVEVPGGSRPPSP
ncbi:MAG TPA: hypothetical protein VGP25_09000 [Gemmatimonadaceae bacterium]|nr:hypothetical protein [Gemmatimonadaceae bacterium]